MQRGKLWSGKFCNLVERSGFPLQFGPTHCIISWFGNCKIETFRGKELVYFLGNQGSMKLQSRKLCRCPYIRALSKNGKDKFGAAERERERVLGNLMCRMQNDESWVTFDQE